MSDNKLVTLGQMKSDMKDVMAELDQASADMAKALDEMDAKNADVEDLDNYLPKSAVDSALSSASTNPVQNKVVNAALAGKLPKLTYEWSKQITFGSTGVLKIGEFPVYDTMISVDFSSSTAATYNGKLIVACQNNVIKQAVVYGDYANTLAPLIYIVPSDTTTKLVTIYFKPPGWSKNAIHIKCVSPYSAPDESAICVSADAVPSTATLQPTNPSYKTAATTTAAGLMSAADKIKLNGLNFAIGTCSTAAATAAKAVTVDDDNWTLQAGSIVAVKFTISNSAAKCTLNVNGTGAKNIWYNNMDYTTGSTSTSTAVYGYANRYTVYMYDGTYWVWISQGSDSNTTYTNASLGQGYATCSTAESTAAKTASLSSYALTTGGIVAVKFTNAVPASATLNVNNKGAKAIYYRGAAITADVIAAGDIATFIYNGSQYHLLAIDRMAVAPTIAEIDAAIAAL